MKITSDWHIHSENSCDSACLKVRDLPADAAREGLTDFGLTDHLHTPYNLPDVEASRRDFLAVNPSPHFHFGIEVSCVSEWELDELAGGGHKDPVYGLRSGGPAGAACAIGITAEDVRRLGIEYVVAGTHWPLYVPFERQAIIRDYHRQNMFLATHPFVTIVAHPWWWMGHWQHEDKTYPAEPWFDDFRVIPQSLHDEFAAAAVQNRKVVEINIWANLLNHQYPPRFAGQYMEYIAGLKARGVRLSIGSDTHQAHLEADLEGVARLLDGVGITEKDLWRLPPRGRGKQSVPSDR